MRFDQEPPHRQEFGYVIDPEFFIYQHKQGRRILELAQGIFGTGRIYPKPGNEDVLVFAIDNRRSIRERVIPFLDNYLVESETGRMEVIQECGQLPRE